MLDAEGAPDLLQKSRRPVFILIPGIAKGLYQFTARRHLSETLFRIDRTFPESPKSQHATGVRALEYPIECSTEAQYCCA